MSRSHITSFAHLITDTGDGDAISRIEIPLIQRDYAQGRDDAATARIRASFLDALHLSLTSDVPKELGLDFVYGHVDVSDGALRLLDGQQRLTTLFLLHWYFAHRTKTDLTSQRWTAFTYATRASARLFCERLVAIPPPSDCVYPAEWICDQPWFQYVWRHDPTIQSMLTMISAIHERFEGEDPEIIWRRLTDSNSPAVSFHLLTIRDMNAPEDLYIKMNSRGKPLTEFENFKARLEADIAPIDPYHELAHKVDGAWADVFWSYRGDDDIIDDKILRYIRLLIEICEWKKGVLESVAIERRARKLFDSTDPAAREYLEYVMKAFDTWVEGDPADYFSQLFTTLRGEPLPEGPIPLFINEGRTNLFEACVMTYGKIRGSTRVFSFGQQLLLAAVLAYRVHVSTEVDGTLKRRIRVIRNLIEASENEIRLDRMPTMLAEVEDIVLNGLCSEGTVFNRAQFDDEVLKDEFLARHPELEPTVFRLEDHTLLRGALVAFDLDAEVLLLRADAFTRAFRSKVQWTLITAALLAAGSYARPRGREQRSFQFGVGEEGTPTAWRAVLATGGRNALAPTREALATMLDAITAYGDVEQSLSSLREEMLKQREASGEFDWRYYFVKYDSMREGKSGIYFGGNGSFGYLLCMLNKTQLNSYYRDPYLLAIWRESGVGESVEDPWFTGYESGERWLALRRSGAGIRCVDEGFVVSLPNDIGLQEAFQEVCRDAGVRDGYLHVPRKQAGDDYVDEADRVQAGAGLLRALVAGGY